MIDSRLSDLAASRLGIFTYADLERLGISKQTARRRVADGSWVQVHRGVFRHRSTPEGPELLHQAALSAFPSAVLSRESARWLHGLRGDRPLEAPSQPNVTVPIGGRNRLAGVLVTQQDLPADHITRRRGWNVTTVERTIVDLAAVWSIRELRGLLEDALVDRRTRIDRLLNVIEQGCGQGRAGSARIRELVAHLDEDVPESVLEREFLQLVRRNGLGEPTGQARFPWLGNDRCRVDFFYESAGLIVELDGRSFHARTEAFERDRRRDLLALSNGFRTLRLSAAQLRNEGEEVVAALRSVLTRQTSG